MKKINKKGCFEKKEKRKEKKLKIDYFSKTEKELTPHLVPSG